MELHTIDLKTLGKDNFNYEIIHQLRDGLRKHGFIYLINHQIPQAVISNGFEGSKKFFNLDTSIKSRYQKVYGKMRHGWIEVGQELMETATELREGYDFMSEDDYSEIPECPEFITSMSVMRKECKAFMKRFLPLLAMSLELDDEKYFIKCCSHLDNPQIPNECTMRAIYYPPIQGDEIFPKSTRCAEHTDYELCTLLFQDDMGGLEVKADDGSWIPVKPVAGSIVVNTGDLFQRWTAGYYTANEHRVIIPQKELEQRKARYSFAFFFPPDNSTVIKPLLQESKILKENEAILKFKDAQPVTAIEHIMSKNDAAYKY